MRPARFTIDPHILDNTDLSRVDALRHWQHQLSVLLEQLQSGIIQLPPTPSSSVYLDGNGNWSTPAGGGGTPAAHAPTHITGGSDVIPAPTTSATGLVPTLPVTLGTSKFLRGDATFSQPDYSNLTGVPSTFTPAAHGATHAGSGSDPVPLATTTVAGLAPAKPNAGVNATTTQVVMGDDTRLTNTRTPTAHASTHITGGSDVIPVATASATGALPALSGTAGTFLNGTGAWTTPSVGAPPSSLTDLGSPAGNSTVNTGQAFLIAVNLIWTTVANWTLTLQNVILGAEFHLRFLNSSGAARTFTITATNPGAASYTIAVYVPGSNALTGVLSINNGNAINLRGVSYTVGGNPTIQLFGFGSTG